MSIKIYLVEDQISLNLLLKKYLQREGYEVTTFLNGNSAVARIDDMPDLWILDIMLPDITGYEIIKAVKAHNKNTPVIFMSSKNKELDRVMGLELGSDDYLSKPFLPRELIIRTNKLIERIYGSNINDITKIDDSLNIGIYRISKKQRTFFMGKIEIIVTKKEFELLYYFIENRNNLVTREQILDTVWGDNYFGSDRVVDDVIKRIRKKIDKFNIETVYGYGYRLVYAS